MKTLRWLPLALSLLSTQTVWGQDPQEYPGLLVVSAPPEEVGEFIAGVCDPTDCLRPPREGIGPARLVPGLDPGYPDLTPPIGPNQGCTNLTNADEVDGNFALIPAGGCATTSKFYYVREAGAVGVVLYPDASVGADDDSTLANIEWDEAVVLYFTGVFISRYRALRLLAAHEDGQEVVAEMRMNPDVVAAEPPAVGQAFRLSVTPNPTRGDALVRVEAAHPAEARVSVFDGVGREVVVLHEGPLPAGPSAFRLSGVELAGGVYLVRLVAATPDGRRVSEVQRVTRVR